MPSVGSRGSGPSRARPRLTRCDAGRPPELRPLPRVEQAAERTHSCFESLGAEKGQINLCCLHSSFCHSGAEHSPTFTDASPEWRYIREVELFSKHLLEMARVCVSEDQCEDSQGNVRMSIPTSQADQIRLRTNVLNYFRQFSGPLTFENLPAHGHLD